MAGTSPAMTIWMGHRQRPLVLVTATALFSGHDKKKAAGAAAFVAYHPRL